MNIIYFSLQISDLLIDLFAVSLNMRQTKYTI